MGDEKVFAQARIELLDALTANQIAAGEVIERPVSVMKELVENAIDAGGTVISAEYRDGGLSLIRVTDDGGGIDRRDLSLAVERHATSKLRQIQDLDDLTTLGFRGEALASIASVASLEIETRKRADVEGYRLRVKGADEEPIVEKVGCPAGTRVTVEHLFYNTPARLKFMKSPGYEGGLIHDLMIRLALGYPHIGFRLENQGKILFDTTDIDNTEDLAEMFFGKEARQALIPVEADVSKGRLSGWITAPPYSRGTRKGLHVFVNGRHINLKDMQWAIERAFEYILPKGRFPLAILNFRFPGSLLDVNVHPGKLEIRINDPDMNPSLTRALKTAVSGGQPTPLTDIANAAVTSAGEHSKAAVSRDNLFTRPVRDWETLYEFTGNGERQLDELIRGVLHESGAGQSVYESGPAPAQWGVNEHNQSLRALAANQKPDGFSFGPGIEFTVVGQLHGTFILAEVADGLLIVDQHVAHERILYEGLSAKSALRESAQMLMQPISVNLTTGEEEILIQNIVTLNDLGFVLERFGSRQYLIRSEPAGQSVDQFMFKELLEQIGDKGRGTSVEYARQALLTMNACKAAVKANTPLDVSEMNALLAGLRTTEYPMTCPHGRPIMYLLPYRRLIQAFGRSS